ncbi:VOC family protein [Bosea sp. (in: a-proteobacteria)]|jgi:catechol 2,3-dioxygenase-like lactoylglutathione lyase family enzyme|uniref:VOC family protein n=1 Tax=Bosea sp. (in: a-proteobacteria) TaxID=1871050 RepID=UPI002DDD4706|nr:VOC family protein [Bosea sp. (in: a-proteobacteria)]HEV2509644.1 VOC family protein [Bosea sp. (in: a-proteobacteria)]
MPETTKARGLDHLVIGVADLDAAGAFYADLGFRVGARNRHPWGTENRIVQFPGAFLELITVGDASQIPPHAPRHFSFGAFVRDALARGEGMSMLVLESRDSTGDANGFRAAGVGDFEPFFFERQARRPDGSEVRVAFSLAFAENQKAPECGFFVCQQHEPQNFWNPAFQQHENGASGLSAVFLVARQPAAQAVFLNAFSGAESFATPEAGLQLTLPRGRLEVLTPQAAAARLDGESRQEQARFAGFAVAVPELEPIRSRLVERGVAHRMDGARIIVPAQAAFGCAIQFEMG